MSIGLVFWILMLCWAVFSFAVHSGRLAGPYGLWGNTILLFVLFLLVGWGTFGAPIRG